METHLSILRHNRALFSKFIESLSVEQLNTIPEGYNNNVIWNIAHIIVTQQLLMYKLAGLKLHVPKEWVALYSKGSAPKEPLDQVAIDEIKSALFSTIDDLEADLKNNLFENYTPYTTSTNIVLDKIETTFPFVLFHDGIHLGAILALKKFL